MGEDTWWGEGSRRSVDEKREHECFQTEMDDKRSREGWRAEQVGGGEGKDK